MYWDENGVGYLFAPIPDSNKDTRQWKRFRDYDEKNPHIYDAFKSLTFEAIRRGHKRIGANFVGNLLRWERPEFAKDDIYKVNNDFFPYYARKFMLEYPDYKSIFELRRLRAM